MSLKKGDFVKLRDQDLEGEIDAIEASVSKAGIIKLAVMFGGAVIVPVSELQLVINDNNTKHKTN
jgi:hypothetical protein